MARKKSAGIEGGDAYPGKTKADPVEEEKSYLESYTKYMYYMGLWTKRRYFPGLSPLFWFVVPAYTFFFITSAIELAHNWGDLNAMTETVDMTLIFAVTGYKVFNVMWDEKEWKRLVTVVENNFNRPKFRVKPEDRYIMEDSVRSNRYWGTAWTTLVSSMLTVFTVRPMIESAIKRRRAVARAAALPFNSTEELEPLPSLWHLPYRTWSPFDHVTGYPYALVYALHLFIAAMQIVFVPVFDMFLIALINYTCGQFVILQKELRNVRRDAKAHLEEKAGRPAAAVLLGALEAEDTEASAALDDEMHTRIRDYVEHHETLLKFCIELESVCNRQLLSHFFCTSVIVCTSAFQLADRQGGITKLAAYAELLCCANFEMGMFCFFCDRLIRESTAVGYAVYCSEWYHSSLKFRRSVSIIMSRALRPCYLTFGRFTELSLETYAGILRISFGYFSVLNGMNE